MSNKAIFALGADIKNRFLIVKGDRLYYGPDIGDLSDVKNYEFFKTKVKNAVKKFKPDILAYDMHPGYFSSQLAKEICRPSSLIRHLPVQHHHAHIASVMREHNLKRPIIGISFDGTGYGLDANIWGGEFLIVDKKGFKRAAYFKYRPMPGADKVIYEPWRMVLSILGKKALSTLTDINKQDKALVLKMIEKKINSPLTSSAGRLFDAAAALLGICRFASYEAQGPIALEALCDEYTNKKYKFDILKENNHCIIDTDKIFLGMLKDIKGKTSKNDIATKFHNSFVDIIVEVSVKISKTFNIKDIALSGGVFQNKFLSKKSAAALKKARFNVFANIKTSGNDYNISLGQYHVSCNSRKN